jgi:hypothetical protein
MQLWRMIVITGVAFAMGCSDGPRSESEHYYQGKRIQIIIPTSVGGGTDRFARLMGEGLNKFVPGNPEVVPRQMTGGGGILGANWVVERAPRDGTVLFATTGQGTLRQILGQKALRATANDFEDLIALPATRTVVIAQGKGVERREDIANLRNGGPLHTALVDPIGGISFVVQAGLVGMPLRIIPGYHGGRDRDLAMLRGEIDIIQQIAATFNSSTQPLLDRGDILLWVDGLAGPDGRIVRDPGMADVPTFPEVFEAAFGEPPSGPLWDVYKHVIPLIGNAAKVLQLPVGAPPEAKAALKEGIRAMVADPEFVARIRAESEGHDPVHGDELEALLREARSIPPEKVAFMRGYISERFEMEFE